MNPFGAPQEPANPGAHAPGRKQPAQSWTATTSDSQEQAERALWDARRRRQERARERLLGALYPTADGKRARMGELRRQEEEFLAARAAEKQRVARLEADWQAVPCTPAGAEAIVPCWSANVVGNRLSDEARALGGGGWAEARSRSIAQAARAENARLIEARRGARAEARRREKEEERRTLLAEANRWVAPERRWIAASPPPLPAAAPGDGGSGGGGGGGSGGAAAAPPRPRTASRPPWACDD
ncbi:hypothetical protein Rsub_05988 [Raphidocelis subcapitata]|uniref:Uncharacterized protein n=1 Tax=Raphidocelis subcapitata TaxID=307507 RepID=A0A2V0P056_9CHLO|nr:hypothetical protein Rsub_05988 [Raphidocelis subcapitata]|eukprot:GBF93256.1 hypothetical protein Rsub_05988 [Raphidocelis subcapitata]